MQKPAHHILVCGSFRVSGEAQGGCNKKGSLALMQYMENEIADRGLPGISVSSTGCLKVCERGPAVVIYPENWWFGKVDSESAIDEVLDSLENGSQSEKYLLT